MHKSNHHAVRMALQKYHDGLTVSELVERTEKERRAIDKALLDMPDAYIDRWISGREHRKQWAAVWCVVVPPENCPKPTEKPIDRTRNQPTRLSSDVCYGRTTST